MTIRINDEYRVLINLYKREGLDLSLFEKRMAAVIINGSRILHLNTVEGVSIEGSEAEDGVTAEIKIEEGVKLPFPIHLCTGFLRNEGFQKVIFNINVGADAEVRFLSHCIFPYAKNFTHEAIARIKVGKNAIVTYDDTHVHGEGVRMISKSDVEVLDGGRYIGRFSLTKHRAKELKFETNVKLGNYSSAEISSKVKAVRDDNVEMKEVLSLEGSYSRGRIKSIVIASDEARVNVINEVYGLESTQRDM
ncbi:SufD family Fe-S cluster assembly protein [Thermococcus sp.]|uniref:SufD family Fe-S cluster assembly protein n=1 Tax=Thermococcus sp. TaxID=35749 RepID=UPI0034220105